MPRKLASLFVGVVASLAFAAGVMQGCGGSSGSNSNVATCERFCDKVLECTPDAGALGMQLNVTCKQDCPARAAMCSNANAIATAINSCLAMDCAGATSCFMGATIPACQSSTGTGGTTGAGGTTGTGGSTGAGGTSGGGCPICVKTDACCVALGGTTAQCATAASCQALPAAQQATVESSCQTALDALAMQPNAPAACR